MKKNKIKRESTISDIVEKLLKFERVYEDETCIATWKYDLEKYANGPCSVEYKWKAGAFKTEKLEKKWKESKELDNLKPMKKDSPVTKLLSSKKKTKINT